VKTEHQMLSLVEPIGQIPVAWRHCIACSKRYLWWRK